MSMPPLGNGRVITVELDARKTERAREHVRAANLSEYVSSHCADARTLFAAQSWGPVDLLFLDGPKALYREVLALVEPHLRDGALIVSDNSEMLSAQDFLSYLRAPNHDYTSVLLGTEALGTPYRHELAVRCHR